MIDMFRGRFATSFCSAVNFMANIFLKPVQIVTIIICKKKKKHGFISKGTF